MPTEEITIRVDSETARVYRAAPEDERRKIDLLISMRIKDATRSDESLQEIMRDFSAKAQERGLTPEMLETIPMASKSRYVFDTSAIVSALLFEQSTPGRAVHEGLERGEIPLSQPLVEELNDVLSREKFQRYVHRDERERFLIALVRAATLIEVTERIDACRDPTITRFSNWPLRVKRRKSPPVTKISWP